MPTIKNVAKQAGVSIATVSYVLNDKLDMVSEDTRQQVLSTAREMGYRPNVTARNLQAKSTGLIGFAWPIAPEELESAPMMARFMCHLAQAVEAAGYHILAFTHPADAMPNCSPARRAAFRKPLTPVRRSAAVSRLTYARK